VDSDGVRAVRGHVAGDQAAQVLGLARHHHFAFDRVGAAHRLAPAGPWIRAAKLSDRFRPCYTTIAAAGRRAERLTNLLAVLCVVARQVFWLTMTSRATPDAPAETALTKAEVEILDRLTAGPGPPAAPKASRYLVAIAKLGGYLARVRDPPPGNMVDRRGLTRLMDIHLGFELSRRIVGD
jgi:hypothetical protein